MSKNQTCEALESAGMRMTCTMHDYPIPEGFAFGSHAWKVQLRYKGRSMTIPFFTGSMCGEVTIADVTHCLISNAQSTGLSFEDFCSDFGYNTDSRKAEATYKACQRNAVKLENLLRGDLDKFSALVQDY